MALSKYDIFMYCLLFLSGLLFSTIIYLLVLMLFVLVSETGRVLRYHARLQAARALNPDALIGEDDIEEWFYVSEDETLPSE